MGAATAFGGVTSTVTAASSDGALALPAASVATTVYACGPSARAVVSMKVVPAVVATGVEPPSR